MRKSLIPLPPCEIVQCESAETLASAAALDLYDYITASSVGGQPILVALSGGRIARQFFRAVTEAFVESKQPLSHVHFFWADERCVPPSDLESNFRLASEFLLKPLQVSPDNIHRIRGEEAPEVAAAAAEQELRDLCKQQGRVVGLDLVLLGMGEDGHVASLFPGESTPEMNLPALYRPVKAVKPPPQRVTLGYGALCEATQVWVLASGAGKEAALHTSLEPEPRTPMGRVLHSRKGSRIYTELGMFPRKDAGFPRAWPG